MDLDLKDIVDIDCNILAVFKNEAGELLDATTSLILEKKESSLDTCIEK
jgi:hypothetical protein